MTDTPSAGAQQIEEMLNERLDALAALNLWLEFVGTLDPESLKWKQIDAFVAANRATLEVLAKVRA